MNHRSIPARLFAVMLLALLGTACTQPFGMQSGPEYGPRYGPGFGPGYWGMGPGMPGAGPGSMGGYGPGGLWGLERLDLGAEQRTQIARIQDEFAVRHDALMRLMPGQGGPMRGPMFDDGADRRSYEQQAELHKQMFEMHLQVRQRTLAVLTPAQREQLGRGYGPR